MIQMIRAMDEGHPMGFTLDGPRGPRHVAKPGPIVLAKNTGNPILPVAIEPRRSYRINSWDRLQIPFPFTTGRVICAEPIYVSPDADRAELESKRLELQQSLDRVNAEAARWRARK